MSQTEFVIRVQYIAEVNHWRFSYLKRGRHGN